MKIQIQLESYDKDTPFEFANAIIRHQTDIEYIDPEESLLILDEIADHLKVYVEHAKKHRVLEEKRR